MGPAQGGHKRFVGLILLDYQLGIHVKALEGLLVAPPEIHRIPFSVSSSPEVRIKSNFPKYLLELHKATAL